MTCSRRTSLWGRCQSCSGVNTSGHVSEGFNSLECGDLSPLWSVAAWRHVLATQPFPYPRLRQVATDQSADRSAHSKELKVGRSYAKLVVAILLLTNLGLTGLVAGQQLEPRAYSVSPVGTNIVVVGYGRSTGDLSFDPSLPITDASATINGAFAGYFRSIDFFGRSASVSVALPYAWGNLQGNVEGQFQQVRRSGLGDPSVRFAVNLRGAPAMDLKKFSAYRQKTIIGASVVVVAPLGQYDPAKFINLSGNRWAFKPEIGISRAVRRRLFVDFYLGAWVYTANNNFRGRTRTQAPIASSQFHLSYNVKPKVWVAFDATFYAGGRTTVNGLRNDDLQRNSRVGGTFSYKLDHRQSLKFAYSRGAFTNIGADFQAVSVAYQYLWGRGL